MRAICFIQEVKGGDLTMRQQILICRKALRKLRWPCVQELYAQAGTEEQPLTLRPGMAVLLRAAADGEADVLIVVDAEHLHCGRPELEGLIASLLCYGIHTFGVKCGWIEPGGRQRHGTVPRLTAGIAPSRHAPRRSRCRCRPRRSRRYPSS